MPQSLAVRIKQLAKLSVADERLTQQTAVTEFPCVAGLRNQSGLGSDPWLEELRRVDAGARVVFGQGLLRWK